MLSLKLTLSQECVADYTDQPTEDNGCRTGEKKSWKNSYETGGMLAEMEE